VAGLTDAKLKDKIKAALIRHLTLLKKQGVKFAIGMDSYGMNSLPEAM